MPLKREEIKENDKWAVNAICLNDMEWEKAFTQLSKKLKQILIFKGKLKESAQTIADFYQDSLELELELERLYTYAHMKHDEDTRNDFYRSMQEKIYNLSVQYGEMTSWSAPELLHIEERVMLQYLQTNELAPYRFDLEKLLRKKEHILSDKEERLLSLASLPLSATSDVFGALTDADMKFPKTKDSQGVEKELSHATYSLYLHSQDRDLRKNSFLIYHRKYDEFSTAFAALLQGEIRSHVFTAKARGYETALDAAVFGKNIDRCVYTNLIQAVRQNISVLHDYTAYRKKKLKVEKLHFYDLYVQLVKQEERKVSYDEAREIVLEAVKPLGDEYNSVLKKGLYEEKWVDIYENENKRSGAYSTGSYLTRPYILMNFNGTLDSVRTLAHEAGHSMHSYFTHTAQPPVYGSYPIFLAEVASTFNEELMNHYLLQKTEDKNFKAYLITSMIEDIRATLFRQTLFAEFELKLHEMIENGIPLTAQKLKKEYLELYHFYYGESLELDEEIAIEWARIPHFYYNYYVYQYATGISAALSLFQKVIRGGISEREEYLNFLKAGCSKYPLDILKEAGVDMRTTQPIEDAISQFNQLLIQLKTLEGEQ